jgi:hypothetical protein
VIREGSRIRYFVNNLDSLTDVEALRSTTHCRSIIPWGFRLLWCVMLRRRDTNLQGWILREYQSYLPLFVSVLIEYQRLNKRDWIGHCFHGTVKRFFFLTLDSIAFDHFPLSLVTLTLFLAAITNKLLGDNCQFLFRQQSSLVRFLILCFFFYFRCSLFSQ